MNNRRIREPSRFHRQLVRGAAINAMGLLGKLMDPVFVLVVTWVYGPAIMGVYFLATFLGDIASAMVGSGVADATTIFGSHDSDGDDRAASNRLYDTLATAMVITLGGAVVLIALTQTAGRALVAAYYPNVPDLGFAVSVVAWSLPAIGFTQIAIAATKARMHMEHDAAIMGFLRPAALLAFSAIAWWLGAGLRGLMTAYLCAQVVAAVAAGRAFKRHYRISRMRSALTRRHPRWQMVAFAIPQSLNMTFSRYMTRLDVIMLAGFGHGPAAVAFYATAALITSNLRQIRIVFSTALAPVAARHHRAGERETLQATLGQVSRWTTTIVIPLVLVIAVLRDDLLRFVDASYVGDTRFMVLLLLPPLLSCSVGLAGNLITYTGHSGWTMTNSVAVALANTGLNWILIPRYGLLGAATATAIAATGVTVLQLIELRLLEGITVQWRHIAKPVGGGIVGAAVFVALGDPVSFPGPARAATAVAIVVLFLGLMGVLGHQEVRGGLARWSARRRVPDAGLGQSGGIEKGRE